jgi:hypothetical protein
MLARGLSVRDIEDAFKDESGRLLLSKTAVSELGERLWEDYQAFARRDLSEYEIVYLFVDGIAERLRPGGKREPVLAFGRHAKAESELDQRDLVLPVPGEAKSLSNSDIPAIPEQADISFRDGNIRTIASIALEAVSEAAVYSSCWGISRRLRD